MLDLPCPLPAHILALVRRIFILHSFIPWVQVFRVAPYLVGFQQQGACVAGKRLAAVRELVFGAADFRKGEGLQRPDKLVKTILACFS